MMTRPSSKKAEIMISTILSCSATLHLQVCKPGPSTPSLILLLILLRLFVSLLPLLLVMESLFDLFRHLPLFFSQRTTTIFTMLVALGSGLMT